MTVRPAFDAGVNRGLAAFYDRVYGVSHTAFDVPPADALGRARTSRRCLPDVAPLIRNGVAIDDTFAEAFDMRATALVITAPTLRWARIAAASMTGFATSIIACGVEAGIDAICRRRRRRTAGRGCGCCCSPAPPRSCRSN